MPQRARPRAALIAAALVALITAACTQVRVVEDGLAGDATHVAGSQSEGPRTVFYADEEKVTLSVLLGGNVFGRHEPLMVEWLLPDGRLYLRRAARPARGDDGVLVAAMVIRGEPPARWPGLWHVRLSLAGEMLLEREFEIRARRQRAGAPALATRTLACHDLPGAGAARAAADAFDAGSWVGARLLGSDEVSYAGSILLSSAGCLPRGARDGTSSRGAAD